MGKGIKNTGLWVLSIALACFLLYHFARNANWGEVSREVSASNPYYVILAVLGEVFFLLIRAVRWKMILEPLKRKISNWSLLRATVVSFAISGVAPAKLGEVARPAFLSRWEGVPFTTSVASIILERGLDLIAIVFFWFLFIVIGDDGVSPGAHGYMSALNKISVAILVLAGVALALLLWFANRKESFQKMAGKNAFLLRSPILGKLVDHFFIFTEGLQSFRKKRTILLLFLVSIIAWGSVCLTCYFAPKAMGVELPWESSFLVLTLVCIGASLPTPGGVGGVHKAIYIALVVFYGINEEMAVSTALICHAVMFLPAILWGAAYVALGKVKFGEMNIKSEPDKEPA